MKLYLIRHGEAENNVHHIIGGNTDHPLTELGKEQAATLDSRLGDVNVVFSSELQRARDTATILATARGLSPIVRSELNELDFGLFKGLTFAMAKEKYPKDFTVWIADWSKFKAPKGEYVGDVLDRLKVFYTYLVQNYKDSSIAVVAHQMTIRCLIQIVTGADGIRSRISNTGIVSFDINENGCYFLF